MDNIGPLLRKLSESQAKAGGMGLEGTAERLDILRSQLLAFKDLSDRQQRNRAEWAIMKIDETSKTMRQEIEDEGERLRAQYSPNGNGILSAAIYGLSLLGGGSLLLKWPELVGGELDAFKFASLSVATIMTAAFIDTIASGLLSISEGFDTNLSRIEDNLRGCRRAIEGLAHGPSGDAVAKRIGEGSDIGKG